MIRRRNTCGALRRTRLWLAWCAATCACLLAGPATGHIGHLGGAFHAETRTKACALAGEQHKLVFMYVTAPAGPRCEYLDRPTAREAPLVDLLLRETIITVLDRAQHADELQLYELEPLPALYLLNPDGSVRVRYVGTLESAELVQQLRADLTTPDAVDRARQYLASAPDGAKALARERLARALIRAGELEEGFAVYEQCLAACRERRNRAAAARRRVLLRGLLDVAREHRQAQRLLDRFRKEVEQSLVKGADPRLGQDWAELNHWLDDDARTLKLYDRLPDDNVSRFGLFDHVFDQLIDARRYDEVLEVIEPHRAFRTEAFQARSGNVSWLAARTDVAPRGTRAFAVGRGARLVEALAATDAAPEARELINAVLAFDDSSATAAALVARLQRGSHDTLIDYVHTRVGAVGQAPTGSPSTAGTEQP